MQHEHNEDEILSIKEINRLAIIEREHFYSPEEQLKREIDGQIRTIASEISYFLYVLNQHLELLNYQEKEANKNLNPRHDTLLGYADIIKDTVSRHLKRDGNLGAEKFKEGYIQDADQRVKEKLEYLNKPELILGFEYILDHMIEKEEAQSHYKQFEDKVTIEDLFDSETIANIENHFYR